MKITLEDDKGNRKTILDPEFMDENVSFFDFIASHMNPCGGCGLLVLIEKTDEEDGFCKECAEMDAATSNMKNI